MSASAKELHATEAMSNYVLFSFFTPVPAH